LCRKKEKQARDFDQQLYDSVLSLKFNFEFRKCQQDLMKVTLLSRLTENANELRLLVRAANMDVENVVASFLVITVKSGRLNVSLGNP
jgi:hypothetical protein